MGKIVKENGKIWFEEVQDLEGKHRRITLLGVYTEEKPKKNKQKKGKN